MNTIRVYVQNWRTVSRKSDVVIVMAAFAKRFETAVADITGCQFEVIEYRPNFAAPMSYDDVMCDDAWSLWSSVIMTVEGRGELSERLEALLRDELGCPVHVETVNVKERSGTEKGTRMEKGKRKRGQTKNGSELFPDD